MLNGVPFLHSVSHCVIINFHRLDLHRSPIYIRGAVTKLRIDLIDVGSVGGVGEVMLLACMIRRVSHLIGFVYASILA